MTLYNTEEELDALIDNYRRGLDSLEQEKILRRKLALKSRPSIIQRVPPEVFLVIFSMLLDNDSRNMISPSQVCRLWRSLLTEMSALWTCIVLGDFDEDEEAVHAHLRTCIQRAGPRPLSLSINPNNDCMDPYTLLEAVLKVARKSEWISISYVSSDITEFIPFFDGRFDLRQIRSLSLTCDERAEDSDEEEIFELDLSGGVVDMRSFTHLESLSLHFVQQIDTATLLVPWAQLTNLELEPDIDSSVCLSILKLCINLENCTLHPDTEGDLDIIYDENYKRKPIRLPKLKQLHLWTSQVPSLLPDTLKLPTLRDATFHYSREEEYGDCVYLLSFIGDCGRTIRNLQLPGLMTNDFMQIQADLKVLEELTITGPFGWPENIEDYEDKKYYDEGVRTFFKNLRKQPGSLPKMKVLRMLGQRLEEKASMEREVAQFIESRLSERKELGQLKVFFRLDQDASNEQRDRRQKYRKWQARGVTVDFE
ncbi:hypothetical protein NLJ89_g1606 [Agrocybe chaxingu]|uniref:F-box domain-containing protein n=1 Tax=Agrocybe chaxingu TaxID=84603 RepID=A0A9W8MZQ7_9AGAR|nr:hypothetical protein NLJ89_g1606 [Agrocybe chaxingu]